MPLDIEWHFIGALQTNKIASLVGIVNLSVIETVDSIEKAIRIDSLLTRPMDIFIQVNTSQEVQKNGINPKDLIELVGGIKQKCLKVKFAGLMTIGSRESQTNDFICLQECKNEVIKIFGMNKIELSMGMSMDYLEAVDLNFIILPNLFV